MRKIFSIFAIAAVVLGMASCGDGNEPDASKFQIEVQQTVGEALITVTAADKDAYFFLGAAPKRMIEDLGGAQKYAEEILSKYTFSDQLVHGWVYQEQLSFSYGLHTVEEYMVVVCLVEQGDSGYAKIISNMVTKTFLPIDVMPGEFSVSANKKVHFARSNYFKTDYGYDIWRLPYGYVGSQGPETPYDLHTWIDGSQRFDNDYYVPSAAEWLYILKERPHADELFAHATIHYGKNVIHGIILLPDNFQMPEGITLKTSKEMGMVWNNAEYGYAAEDGYDGYAQNIYNDVEWRELEFAGAVFLPANSSSENKYGWYWSSTGTLESYLGSAHAFSFGTDDLSLDCLKGSSVSKKYHLAVRLVREVK